MQRCSSLDMSTLSWSGIDSDGMTLRSSVKLRQSAFIVFARIAKGDPAAYTSTVAVTISIVAVALLLGLLFGSFLNVLIVRLPADESIVSPRSRCVVCGHAIRWYDNVPLLSYVLLRGKCRDCGARIPWRYPAVEFGTGLWFVIASLPLLQTAGLPTDTVLRLLVHQVSLCALGFFLIGLMVTDWRDYLLPDGLTYAGILVGLFFACCEAIFLGPDEGDILLHRQVNLNAANSGQSPGNIFLTGPEHLIFSRLFAAALAFLLLYLIRLAYRAVRKRDGMGLGDAKLLALIASFLSLELTVLAFFAGALLASVYAVILLARRRAGAATRLPFGSFLAAGGLLAAAEGQRLLDWYASLFR